MVDRLAQRYRNISGTILVINDLNYLEIGINEVIDLSLFSDDFLDRSRDLRKQIALNNLLPDESNVEAKRIDENSFNNGSLSDDIVNRVVEEVKKQFKNDENKVQENSISEDSIKKLLQEFSDVILDSIKNRPDKLPISEEQSESDIDYEQEIVNSSVKRLNEALNKTMPNVKQKASASEISFEDEDYISDLKKLIDSKESN